MMSADLPSRTSGVKKFAALPIKVKVTGIQARGLPNIRWSKTACRCYVKLVFAEDVKRTAVAVRGNTASWDGEFHFDGLGSSVLELHVYAQHKMRHDVYIGGVKETLDVLLASGVTADVSRKLRAYTSDDSPREADAVIEFTIEAITAPSATDSEGRQLIAAVEEGTEAIKHMGAAPLSIGKVDCALGDAMLVAKYTSFAWQPLLDKVKLFTKMVDQVAEVHPYAKMAWTILSAANKIVITQIALDGRVGSLVVTMNDVYDFVHDAEITNKIKSHKKILGSMTQQTYECAIFLRDYAKNKSFWSRTVKNLASDIDSKVQQYEAKFREFQAAFQNRAVLEIEITVLRIWDTVETLTAENDLNDMSYASGAGYCPEKGCLPGTREEILEEISDWINSDGDDVPRIFLLNGVAGSGKSAISHTVALRFNGLGRLGSSFYFDRAELTTRRPDVLFSTIARGLAELEPQLNRSLCQVIKGKRSLRTIRSIRDQFNKFIVQPAANLTAVGPILIVIDALDESGDTESRKVLLSVLADSTADLPSNYRIFITARTERDILQALDGKHHVRCKSMDAISNKPASDDISLFISNQLDDIASLENKWPKKAWCQLLVDKAEGLFQWAATACQFVRGEGRGGEDPAERLDLLLSSTKSDNLDRLDRLYQDILTRLFDTNNTKVMERFQSILGKVLGAQEPLSMSSLIEFCDGDDSRHSVELILQPMGSLLSGCTQESIPIRTLHTSFRDYLMDQDRSGPFFVDTSKVHPCFALASFQVMKTGLRFNICQLETSHVLNKDVANLQSRLEKAIPSALLYACRFWAAHVNAVTFDLKIANEVRDFLHTRLLFWLEVLSLIGEVHLASKALFMLMEWSQDDSISRFARDARKFMGVFGSVISQSAPHIYLSALAFAPDQSEISRNYLPHFPRLLRIQSGKLNGWPALQETIIYTNAIMSVAFSPDDKRIVSGCTEGTICLWDAQTGDIVLGPIQAHSDDVWSLAFSYDGKRFVSGSNDTIGVWAADTANPDLPPLTGHDGSIYSVAFSHDSKRIVSGSLDKTIRIWNAETGEAIAVLSHQASQLCFVGFSYDDKQVISGTDMDILVLDVETGDVVVKPFAAHTGEFTSFALSHNSKWIAGAVGDTFLVWDTQTGQIFSGPFKGHKKAVTSIAFSPDGKHIVSGSSDDTIRVWDAETSCIVSGPHVATSGCLAFSHDNTRIVSGSTDATIRVWDAENYVVTNPDEGRSSMIGSIDISIDGKLIAATSANEKFWVWDVDTGDSISGPFVGHNDEVACVAFSYDSKRIVSGSEDFTIRVWAADTADTILGPLEGHVHRVSKVAFSPDGKHILSVSEDNEVRTWNAETGGVIAVLLKGQDGCTRSYAFSHDCKRIALNSMDDHTIQVWDAMTGHAVSAPFHSYDSIHIEFSHDGACIASQSSDQTIRLFNTDTGDIIVGPLRGDTNGVGSMFLLYGNKLIVSDPDEATLRVWNAQTGETIAGPFRGGTGPISSVAISPDTQRIVTGWSNEAIRVWDARPTNNVLSSFRNDTRLEHGWMQNGPSELLFWVPSWARAGLWRPGNVAVISQFSTRLDLNQFVHGTSWQQCKGQA